MIVRHISFSFVLISYSVFLYHISHFTSFFLLASDFGVVCATLHVLTLTWSSAQLYYHSHVQKIWWIP